MARMSKPKRPDSKKSPDAKRPGEVDRNLSVAPTIWNQLGGRRFAVMTGAKTLVYGDNLLQFKLPNKFAHRGINTVVITYVPGKDLYDVDFYRIAGVKVEKVSAHTDIYAEMLLPLFRAETHLETRVLPLPIQVKTEKFK